jgi:hypothetical protein
MNHQRKSGRITVTKYDFGTRIAVAVQRSPCPVLVLAQVHEPYGLAQQLQAVRAAAKEARYAA